jgi:DNA-binding transcriptional ArsR family regulator
MTEGQQYAFRALADPTRRQILMHLSVHDMTIGEVANHFDMTRAAVKKHLLILEEGNLISVQSRGREKINRLEPFGLKSVADWVNYFSQFWDQHLGKLQTAIENEIGKSDDK